MPRRFFLGLYEVNMWGYLWGFTAAQVELLYADVPFIAYKKENNKPKPGQKGYTMTAEKAQKQYEQWLARQRAEKEKGIAVDLNNFLNTGEMKPKDS